MTIYDLKYNHPTMKKTEQLIWNLVQLGLLEQAEIVGTICFIALKVVIKPDEPFYIHCSTDDHISLYEYNPKTKLLWKVIA